MKLSSINKIEFYFLTRYLHVIAYFDINIGELSCINKFCINSMLEELLGNKYEQAKVNNELIHTFSKTFYKWPDVTENSPKNYTKGYYLNIDEARNIFYKKAGIMLRLSYYLKDRSFYLSFVENDDEGEKFPISREKTKEIIFELLYGGLSIYVMGGVSYDGNDKVCGYITMTYHL